MGGPIDGIAPDADTGALPDSDIKLSLHDMGFYEAIRMGQSAEYDIPKDIVVIGVEPGNLEGGMELSPEVGAALQKVLEEVKSEF